MLPQEPRVMFYTRYSTHANNLFLVTLGASTEPLAYAVIYFWKKQEMKNKGKCTQTKSHYMGFKDKQNKTKTCYKWHTEPLESEQKELEHLPTWKLW